MPFALIGGTASAPGAASSSCRCWPGHRCTGCSRCPTVVCRRRRCSASSTGCATRATRPGSAGHRPVLAALAAGEPATVARGLGNDLQAAAISLQPDCAGCCTLAGEEGARAIVSGSGPTVAMLCRDAGHAADVAARIAGQDVCRLGAGRSPGRSPEPSRSGVPDAAHGNLVNLEASPSRWRTARLLDGVSLGVQTGDRIGVLGLNGSGKSTLLAVLAGRSRPQSGRVATLRGLGWPRSPSGRRRPGRTVRDIVLGGFGDADAPGRPDSDSSARPCWTGLGLGGIGLDVAGGQPVRRGAAPGRARGGAGHRRRPAAAGRADQPPRHRGRRLARRPPGRRGAARWSSVTHDRWFLDAVATATWEVVDGDRADPRGRLLATGFSPAPSGCGWPPPPRSGGRTWPARSWPGCAEAHRPARRSRSTGSRPPRR